MEMQCDHWAHQIFISSAAKRSAKWGQSLPADHFGRALYKRSAKGLPQAIEVCQKKIPIEIE